MKESGNFFVSFLIKWGVNKLLKSRVNIYQIYTCMKDLSWLHFGDEPRVQKKKYMKDEQSYISGSIAY